MHTEAFLDHFFTGINYWGSKNATNMWRDYDGESVDADMAAMCSAGITHLRVFPMWADFQPLTALYTTSQTPYEYRFGEDPLPDTPAGRAGVSEEACQKFEHFCNTAEKYGLKLVVGLITGHMSFREFAPPAFAGRHRLSDPTVLKWQLRFVRYFVQRFRNRPCIVGWDLGNEVNNMANTPGFDPDDFYVWCSAIADAIRANDPTRPVISGMDLSSDKHAIDSLEIVRDTCDMHTSHVYNIFSTAKEPLPTMKSILDLTFRCQLSEDVSGIPTFVQEFGAIGYTNCSRKTETEFYRAALYANLAHNCHGVMWWCAFDQGHFRFAPYNWNNIGSDYGFFDKDRNPKPLVAENLRFHELLNKLPGGKLPKHSVNGTILIPRDNGDANREKLLAAYLLGKRANLDLNFHYALNAIPDSPLYLLPSLASNQSIPADRLDELLRHVEQGSVLYMSLGNSLFRQLPEITGVTIAWREGAPHDAQISMGKTRLPIAMPIRYAVESCEAEVLARDENGDPVFFMRRHGKGRIYLLLAPLEKYLSERTGAFYAENEPEYDRVYREIASAAHTCRIADSDSPFIRLTEHPVDENCAYIVAINYSQHPRKAKISLQSGSLTCIHGTPLQDGTLSLAQDDGSVFLFRKNP